MSLRTYLTACTSFLVLAGCSNTDRSIPVATVQSALSPSQRAPASTGAVPLHVLVELTEPPTAVEYERVFTEASVDGANESQAEALATDAAVTKLSYVQTEQNNFASRVATAGIANLAEAYRLQRIYNGIVYVTDEDGLARLRTVSGARSVHVLPVLTVDNGHDVPFVGANQLWSLGVGLKGTGVKIGIIDTGIDYLHANFGGPGTPEAYAANDKNLVEAGTFPNAKVVGGWDFAGATYDARAAATSIPIPDGDPIDGSGHGTHVAGTAAGRGVNADGTTYTGSYDVSLDTKAMRIGPGAAPGAGLYALKVFGDGGGSTSLAPLGVEWATDPNGDGDFSDRLDVINLSLGSAGGSANDPSTVFYRNAVNAGVVVVASAGNSGDLYFITGSPGSAPEVISVAASTAGFYSLAVRVDAPASLAGMIPAGSGFGSAATPVSGDVVVTDPANGCGTTPLLNAAQVNGKVALIVRGTCTFAEKAQNALNAGAIAVLIYNNAAGDPIGLAGPATFTVPVRGLAQTDGQALAAALATETVTVTLDDSFKADLPARGDTIASFSSRGPVRDLGKPMLKPDVAAPGFNVVSSSMGTGNEAVSFSGTSMAAPLTAGVMALLREQHPTWTPAELKALIMNSAGHDLFNLPTGTRTRVSPTRVGAGRIDAAVAAQNSVVAYSQATPKRVSVTFDTVDVAAVATEAKAIALKNFGTSAVTYDVTIDSAVAPPGVTIAPAAATVSVAAGATASIDLTLTADPAAMVRQREATVSATTPHTSASMAGRSRYWLSEASGYVLFTPQGGGTPLRVPYFAAPKPASSLSATGTLPAVGTTGTANLTIAGTGVNTLALATTASQQGVRSFASAFELAYASPKAAPLSGSSPVGYPLAETDNANLRYVGIAATTSSVYFALNTWAPWGSQLDVEFNVYIRRVGAPDWEFVLFNYDLGYFFAPSGPGDVHMSFLQNLASGGLGIHGYLNNLSPTTAFMPTYYNDTVVLRAARSSLGIPATAPNTAIEYQVVTFARRYGLVDSSPILRFEPNAPAFASTLDPALGFAAGADLPPYRDGTAGTIPVTYDLDRARATQTGGVLLISHHNANGARAQAVQVDGLSCTSNANCTDPAAPICDVASGACVGCNSNADCATGYCDVFGTRTCKAGADCRDLNGPVCREHYTCNMTYGTCDPNLAMISSQEIPANTICPNGGIQNSTGYDDNQNGALDQDEILQTSYVCHGSNGDSAVVTPEPAGTNCPNGGVKVQVGSATPAYVCNGADGADGLTPTVAAEPSGANCPAGGLQVQVGTNPPAYVCNGAAGANGLSPTITSEPAGTNCAAGGLMIQVGADAPAYVCHGDSASVTAEAAGANCANGGVKIQVGTAAPAYVCDGAAGADGLTPTVVAEPAGANCAVGGVKIQVGTGAATYVCTGATGASGADGADGVSPVVTVEPAGANCSTGGIKVQAGSEVTYVCNGANAEATVVTTEPAGANCANGGLKIQVGSAAPSYVCNGATGPAGPSGPRGTAGEPAKGCSSAGGSMMLPWLTLGLLLVRRRQRRA